MWGQSKLNDKPVKRFFFFWFSLLNRIDIQMGCHVILKLKPCLKSSTSKFTCPCAGVNSNPLPAVNVVFGNGQQEDCELLSLLIASTVSPHLKVQETSECLAIILQKLTVGFKDNGQKLQVKIHKTLECICLKKHSYVYSNDGSCLLFFVALGNHTQGLLHYSHKISH